jgi:hypothetical protein
MVGEPATPPEEGSSANSGKAGGKPPRGTERYGPLDVLRTRKDDGRSLILYSVGERAAK